MIAQPVGPASGGGDRRRDHLCHLGLGVGQTGSLQQQGVDRDGDGAGGHGQGRPFRAQQNAQVGVKNPPGNRDGDHVVGGGPEEILLDLAPHLA